MLRKVTLSPAIYDRLAALGIDLARRAGPAKIHIDTEFEAPCMCSALIHSGLPFRLGAFSGLVGGAAHASIGRYCSIAAGGVIGPGDHPLDRLTTSWVGYVPDYHKWREYAHGNTVPAVRPMPHVGQSPTTIGNDVWIGAQVFIRGGISIGDGAVLGAGSVVVKDVPAYAIVGGNPARILRQRFDDATVERLLQLQWWRYSYFEIATMQSRDISAMIDRVSEAVASDRIKPYSGKRVRLLEFAEAVNAAIVP